jgi:hypothetical protein
MALPIVFNVDDGCTSLSDLLVLEGLMVLEGLVPFPSFCST